MKKLSVVTLFALGAATIAFAEQPAFDGLAKEMDPATYEKAGLNKLTSDERATLDEFIRNYVAGKQKAAADVAATQAVEKAVKERRVEPPVYIESKIVGVYNGYGLRTVFRLANGQTWKPTNGEIVKVNDLDSPNVTIVKDGFGYKMFIEGAGSVRVKQLQ